MMRSEGQSLLAFPPAKSPQLLNPVVLAYMGDAVFELLVRQYFISLPNHKPQHLHREATKLVSAKAQRRLLERLQPLLTEEEADIARRGRNTKSGSPPKNADPADYRLATALESLFGYLFYESRLDRIKELFDAGLSNQREDYHSTRSEQLDKKAIIKEDEEAYDGNEP